MHNEQVFTPNWMVNKMLDSVGYTKGNIRKKYVIDNSCGDGAFLCVVVERYIEECLSQGVDNETISAELSEFIYGIEIDSEVIEEARKNLDMVADKYGIEVDFWDLYNEDTLDVDRYEGMFDFVVGNPPYCKVHDLGKQYEKVKKYRYAQNGMTDLYLVFFEIGMNMLNEYGKLVYITPSSWTSSLAGKAFRKDCIENGYIRELHDFKSSNVFENATTFTMVSVLSKKRNRRDVRVYTYDDPKSVGECFEVDINERCIDGKIYTCGIEPFKVLKAIYDSKGDRYVVKNGFATLNDKFFLVDDDCPTENTIDVIKASKSVIHRMFYPYDKEGKLLSYADLDGSTMSYMKVKAESMGVNTEADDWYRYGRTQALCDVYKKKYTLNYLVKTVDDIKVGFADEGVGVYSGFYIIDKQGVITLETLEEELKTRRFLSYVKSLCKYKNGGFYTFNTKDLENYLNFFLL